MKVCHPVSDSRFFTDSNSSCLKIELFSAEYVLFFQERRRIGVNVFCLDHGHDELGIFSFMYFILDS